MASAGKRKTTFAKLARENKLRERRLAKQAKKAARKLAAESEPTEVDDASTATDHFAGDARVVDDDDLTEPRPDAEGPAG